MKVFISWSGDLSNSLAQAFRTWLPGALQAVKPYFTPSDIEKGARWNTEITKELEASDVGVLFLTRQNVGSAWLLYEAGALSKKLEKSKVCPIIFGLSPNDLPGPLRQFQATEFQRDDFKKLLKTINSSAGEQKLPDSVLDEVFDMWWPRLETSINKIVEESPPSPDEGTPLRSDREVLEEILELSRIRARPPRRLAMPPEAVSDLVVSLQAAHDAIQGPADPQAAMAALSKMSAPIDYLVRRIGPTKEFDVQELREALAELSFEYEMSDDEIPF